MCTNCTFYRPELVQRQITMDAFFRVGFFVLNNWLPRILFSPNYILISNFILKLEAINQWLIVNILNRMYALQVFLLFVATTIVPALRRGPLLYNGTTSITRITPSKPFQQKPGPRYAFYQVEVDSHSWSLTADSWSQHNSWGWQPHLMWRLSVLVGLKWSCQWSS